MQQENEESFMQSDNVPEENSTPIAFSILTACMRNHIEVGQGFLSYTTSQIRLDLLVYHSSDILEPSGTATFRTGLKSYGCAAEFFVKVVHVLLPLQRRGKDTAG